MNTKLPGFLSKKRTVVVIAIVAGVLLLGWGSWTAYGKFSGRPPTTAQVKRSIWKYLAKKSGGRKFKPDLDLTAPAEIARPSTPVVTNKAGRVRAATSAGKAAGRVLPETTFSAYFRTNQQDAGSYEHMYQLIGEQLFVADRLLESAEASRQVMGLVMASEASTYARTNVQSLWLSARICEAYLWPNLTLVETTNRNLLTPSAILDRCEAAFKEAGETNHLVRIYEHLIARTQGSKTQVDLARFRLSRLYQGLNRDAEALKLLKEIKTLTSPKVAQDIAILERRIAAKKP
jgi:hypothetical protein